MKQDQDEPTDNDDSADLNNVLAEAETEFVTGEEKKKPSASTLAMFGMVLAAVGATYFMMVKAGPKPVAASTETVNATKTIDQFLKDKSQNLKTMQSMLQDTEKVVGQFLLYPGQTQIPLSDLSSNPFRVASANAKATEDDALIKRRREAERQAAMNAVQGLRLQSVMFGDVRRSCMINGKLFGEGDVVDAFSVERINANSVIVRRDVYRYEIRMTRDK